MRLKALYFKLFIVLVLMTGSASGQVTHVVTSLADAGAGSLREAINNSNSGDEIIINVRGTIQITTGTLFIPDGLRIVGAAPIHITIDGSSLPTTDPIIRTTGSGGSLTEFTGITFRKQGGISTGDVGAASIPSGWVKFDQCVFKDCEAHEGAAMVVNGGTVEVTNCSFVNNSVESGMIMNRSTLELVNSTITSNFASNDGAGIFNDFGASLTIIYSTIYQNAAANQGGGIQNVGGTVEMGYSIIADNSGSINDPNLGNSSGTWISLGGNLINSPTAAVSFFPLAGNDQVGTGLTLGLRGSILKDGYGLMYYPIVQPTSSAIDLGSGISGISFDQKRGYRIMGTGAGLADAGACEYTQFYVTNTNGTGSGGSPITGSLGWAIENANISSTPVAIWFDIPPASTEISMTSGYVIDAEMLIDGYTQPGSQVPGPRDPIAPSELTSAKTPVQLYDPTSSFKGITINTGANLVMISGLSLVGFQDGIEMNGVITADVFGCHIGLDSTGSLITPNSRGIHVLAGSQEVTIGGARHYRRNVISGNNGPGIRTESASIVNIVGNLIGTDGIGQISLGNAAGIDINQSSSNVLIGGTAMGTRNIISGNGTNIVCVNNGTGVTIQGNWIGLDVTGQSAFATQNIGIEISAGAASVLIGGTTSKARNIISGHSSMGFEIYGDGHNIINNYIGVDTSGTIALGNGTVAGIHISDGASNQIGQASLGNLISGNGANGILIEGPGSLGNIIQGNLIGTDKTGTIGIANQTNGIIVGNQVDGTTIGGANSVDGNVISGNDTDGIYLDQPSNTTIEGNIIGLAANGSGLIPGQNNGIEMAFGTIGTTIGSSGTNRNVISGNDFTGIAVNLSGSGNSIYNNIIGLQADGITDVVGNTQTGIVVDQSTNPLNIGNTTAGLGNIISGNGVHGVVINDGDINFYGNIVGLDASGSPTPMGSNGGHGVKIKGGIVDLGSFTSSDPNVISNNDSCGVYISNPATLSVNNNYIGTDVSGSFAAGNAFDGVCVINNTTAITIGSSGQANLISGNTRAGVLIDNSSQVTVVGNIIGLDAGGNVAIGNQDGVKILNGANNNVIGSAGLFSNLISGNIDNGVLIDGANSNDVLNNFIGVDQSGNIAVPNQVGVKISNGAVANDVGFNWGTDGNVISGNQVAGVIVSGTATSANSIAGNVIGLDASGGFALSPMQGSGVDFTNGAQGNFMGGQLSNDFNKVGGNFVGVRFSSNANNNEVYGNYIGIEINATPFANDTGVVFESGANNNLLGGDRTLGESNVIANNNSGGVVLVDNSTAFNEIYGNYVGVLADGTSGIGNGSGAGITVLDLASSTQIGAAPMGQYGNIVGSHTQEGILIRGLGSNQNTVEANIVGMTEDGTTGSLPNSWGVVIRDQASNNEVIDNHVAGNIGVGIELVDVGTDNNVILSNLVGLDINQSTSFPNQYGIAIHDGPQNNLVGDTVSGGGNVVTGNTELGVVISNAQSNWVYNNFIGTDGFGNQMSTGSSNQIGVVLNNAQNNQIGDGGAFEQNVISGNDLYGVVIDSSSSANSVNGNFIGVNGSATIVPNGAGGVLIRNGSNNNIIGANAAGNLIGGNPNFGVRIEGAGTTANSVQYNGIGYDAGNGFAIPNDTGVVITDAAVSDTIGPGNIISGNSGVGVMIRGDGTNGHYVVENLIGTDDSGLGSQSNTYGVMIADSSRLNQVGTLNRGNVISGNSVAGVAITDTITGLNQVLSNFIGVGSDGMTPVPNKFGVVLDNRCNINNIGVVGIGNVISGNDSTGILYHAGLNVIRGNFIGVDISGTTPVPNGADGILMGNQAAVATIGGNNPGEGNVISGNFASGIRVMDASWSGIAGNIIGMNEDTSIIVPNGTHGIHFSTGSVFFGVGNDNAGSGNIISGNDSCGIYLEGSSGGVTIKNNFIGTDASGSSIGNSASGIFFKDFMFWGNTVGDSLNGGTQNVIAFNGDDGITVVNDGGNRFYRNSIHSNGNNGIDLGNDGVTANDPGDGDTGANGLQNFPVVTASYPCGSGTVITGFVDTNPNRTIRVEAFTFATADPSNHGEGETFLGWDMDTTDATGMMTFEIFVPTALTIGTPITTTATDAVFWVNTSEFGENSTVNAPPNPPTASADTSYCLGEVLDTMTAVPQVGGTLVWYADAGLTTVIDTADGIVPDTTIMGTTTYFVAEVVAGCAGPYDSVSVTVNPLDDATFTYPSFCSADTGQVGSIATGGGTFSFSPNPGDGSMIDSLTGAITNAPAAGANYNIEYVTGGACPDSAIVTVTVLPSAVVDAGNDTTICETTTSLDLSGSVTGGSTTGQWSTSGTGSFSPSNTDLGATYFPSTSDVAAGSIFIVLTSTNNGTCVAQDDTIQVTFEALPTINAGPDISACANSDSIPLNGIVSGSSTTGIWSTTGDGSFVPNDSTLNGSYVLGSGDLSAGSVVLLLDATNLSSCTSSSDSLVITLQANTPSPAVSGTSPYCEGQSGVIFASGSGSGQIQWYTDTTFASIFTGPGFDPSILGAGTYTVYATETVGGCESYATPYTFDIIANTLTVTEDQTICLGDSTQLNASGNGLIVWLGLGMGTTTSIYVTPDYDSTFVAQITTNGCVFTDSTVVYVDDSDDCGFTINTAFSPDGDGVNETWVIPAANIFPENRVVIFNRWGDEINSFENYNNADIVWDGTNSSGQALPAGTYFYTMVLSGSDRTLSGWVQIVK